MSTLHEVATWLEPIMLVAMVTVFVLTFASLYWPGRKGQVEQSAHIPLEDDR